MYGLKDIIFPRKISLLIKNIKGVIQMLNVSKNDKMTKEPSYYNKEVVWTKFA